MPYRTPIVTGDRVALAPHTDLWMAGCRYGSVTHKSETVTAVDGEHVYQIRLDTGRVVTLLGSDLLGAVAGTPVGGESSEGPGYRIVGGMEPRFEARDASPSIDPDTDRDMRAALQGWGQ